jgi:hypothetical protein
MGLAIARGIVQAHGGKIWIEDGPERKGTSVQFLVPLHDMSWENPFQNRASTSDVPRNGDVSVTKTFYNAETSGEHS